MNKKITSKINQDLIIHIKDGWTIRFSVVSHVLNDQDRIEFTFYPSEHTLFSALKELDGYLEYYQDHGDVDLAALTLKVIEKCQI